MIDGLAIQLGLEGSIALDLDVSSLALHRMRTGAASKLPAGLCFLPASMTCSTAQNQLACQLTWESPCLWQPPWHRRGTLGQMREQPRHLNCSRCAHLVGQLLQLRGARRQVRLLCNGSLQRALHTERCRVMCVRRQAAIANIPCPLASHLAPRAERIDISIDHSTLLCPLPGSLCWKRGSTEVLLPLEGTSKAKSHCTLSRSP